VPATLRLSAVSALRLADAANMAPTGSLSVSRTWPWVTPRDGCEHALGIKFAQAGHPMGGQGEAGSARVQARPTVQPSHSTQTASCHRTVAMIDSGAERGAAERKV
jgi:hypothetical protein